MSDQTDLSQFIPPVYLISVPGSERTPVSLAHLSKHAIKPILIEAVDVHQLLSQQCRSDLETEFPDLCAQDLRTIMPSAGEDEYARDASLANYLSHLRCLRRIQVEGHQCALVLEDDALLEINIVRYLTILSRTSHLWDVLRLHMSQKEFVYGPQLALIESEFPDCENLTIHQYLGGHTGAIAQLYSQTGIERVFEIHRQSNKNFQLCFDALFGQWHRNGLRYCFVRPSLARQNPNMSSTIYRGASNISYHKNIAGWFSFRGRLARALRQLRGKYLLAPWRAVGDLLSLCHYLFSFLRQLRQLRLEWSTDTHKTHPK